MRDKPAASMLDVVLLGPVSARVNGVEVSLGERIHRQLMAVLAESAGEKISAAAVFAACWPDDYLKPERLHSYISRLRGHLAKTLDGGRDLIPDSASGTYCLRLPRDRVDLLRFRDQAAQAAMAERTDPAAAVRLYRAALREWGPLPEGPWRATPLGGLADVPWVTEERVPALRKEYEVALLACLELQLRSQRPRDLLPELHRLTTQSDPPSDEFAALLMRALNQSGQRSQALEAYRQHRQRTADELGAEPSDELKRLHRRIGADDPELRAPTPEGEQVTIPPDALTRLGTSISTYLAKHAVSRPATTEPLLRALRKAFADDPEAATALQTLELTPAAPDAVQRFQQVLIVHMGREEGLYHRLRKLYRQAADHKTRGRLTQSFGRADTVIGHISVGNDFNLSTHPKAVTDE